VHKIELVINYIALQEHEIYVLLRPQYAEGLVLGYWYLQSQQMATFIKSLFSIFRFELELRQHCRFALKPSNVELGLSIQVSTSASEYSERVCWSSFYEEYLKLLWLWFMTKPIPILPGQSTLVILEEYFGSIWENGERQMSFFGCLIHPHSFFRYGKNIPFLLHTLWHKWAMARRDLFTDQNDRRSQVLCCTFGVKFIFFSPFTHTHTILQDIKYHKESSLSPHKKVLQHQPNPSPFKANVYDTYTG
jgi:hypothetical protein